MKSLSNASEAFLIIAKAIARWVWIEDQKLNMLQDSYAKADAHAAKLEEKVLEAYAQGQRANLNMKPPSSNKKDN